MIHDKASPLASLSQFAASEGALSATTLQPNNHRHYSVADTFCRPVDNSLNATLKLLQDKDCSGVADKNPAKRVKCKKDTQTALAQGCPRRYNGRVLFNISTGFDSPIYLADTALVAVFLCPLYAIGAPCLRWAVVGIPTGMPVPGSGLSTSLRACHPRLTAEGRLLNQTWRPLIMAKLFKHAYRALFPITIHLIATVPTLDEAKALARLLIAHGKRIVIQPVLNGFTVGEVC